MKRPDQRGAFGRWLVAVRKERNLSPTEVRDRLREQRGYAMAHSTYAMIESGSRQPTEEQRAHLVAFFGSEPAPEPQPTDANARIIQLLEEQTDELRKLWPAINRLADAIDRSDSRAREQTVEVAGAIGQLADDFAVQSEIRAGRTDAVADALHLMNEKLDALVARTGSADGRAQPPVREQK